MKTIARFSKFIVAYIAWILFTLLFLAVMFLGRDTLLGYLRNYWSQGSISRQFAINFFDRGYVLLSGILWLILMIVIESYFRNGVIKGNLPHRVSMVFGYEILAIFLFHLLSVLLVGAASLIGLQWIVLLGEFVLSAGLIFISRKTAKKIIKLEKS
jgi:hypothetical protein